MNGIQSVVIAGGGLAGAHAATALRGRGFEGSVTLVSDEEWLPYERPPLSKAYLRGESTLEDAQIHPASTYRDQDIRLLLGRRAVRLDPSASRLNLDDGTDLTYDALLIATGASARRVPATASHLDGVHHLRDARDADAIRAAADGATAIAVIGGGWVGSEVAASLRQVGADVALISDMPRPLERVLGPEIAEVYRTLHAERGVRLVHGHVAAIQGRTKVDGVRLSSGQRIVADLVIVGVGAVPRIKLARRAGLDMVADAIAVDEYLRTSVPNIYAAGDVAAAWHPRYGRHLSVQHWDNAIEQGKAAAANMLGANEPYVRTPYFYSDQFDLGMEYRGFAPEWERVVVRGDLAARQFLAFWMTDGRVIAALNANVWDAGEELQLLVDGELRVDVARLADPAVPLLEAA